MGHRNKQPDMPQVSSARLAALAGGALAVEAQAPAAAAPASAAPRRRGGVEPDLSRIRKSAIEETPEQRQRRLAAKTMNFSATILARLIIIAVVGFYIWKAYMFSGQYHRGLVAGAFVIVADLGRVAMKAMTPGSK